MISLIYIFALIGLGSLSVSAEPLRFELKPAPGLKFDYTAFYVTPGQEVELTFRNTDIMLHNLIITAPGKRVEVVKAAEALAFRAAELNYIPNTSDVLWSIPVVEQGDTATVTFTAPMEEASYPYVCTYPGHGYIMYGDMIVTSDPKNPVPLGADPGQVAEAHSMHQELDRPMVRRFFLPDTGPASIAVGLPGGFSYCWDTGACRFRYAWTGGFIEDIESRPSQAPRAAATLAGQVVYREEGEIPVRVGSNIYRARQWPKWKYLGYRVDRDGHPVFEYEVDGVPVKERVSMDHGVITRRFVCETNETVWFMVDSENEGKLQSDGVRESNAFRFDSDGSVRTEFFVQIHLH